MRVRPRRLTTVALLAVALALGAAACSSSSYPAEDATANLERNLQLPADRLSCMRERFEDADVAAVMDPDRAPTDEQRAAFVRAARACIPVEAFAELLASSLPVGPEGDATGSGAGECVRISIGSMTPQQQDQLLVHFSNPAALDADVVRDTTALLVSACGLGTVDPSGTVVGPVPTVPPGSTTATEP